jgi:hypothetical protein
MTPEMQPPSMALGAAVERRRQVHTRAAEFLLGLTHRFWVGRLVFAPGFVQPRTYRSGQSRYLLADDGVARRWVQTWLADFASEIEDGLKQAPVLPSGSIRRWRRPSSNDRKTRAFIARGRRNQLEQLLKNAGFVAWRQLLPYVKAILASQARRLPTGQQLVLRQLPKVFARIERDLRRRTGTSSRLVPREIALTEVQAIQEHRDSLLLGYMPIIRRELATVTRVHIPKRRPPGKNLVGLPRGRGGMRDSPETGDPVDLRPYRVQIMRMRGILQATYTTSLHSRLAWLLEITGIWPFHYLKTADHPHPSPSAERPFPHPSQFMPCSVCKTSARVPICPRRSRLFREWMKDIGAAKPL